MAVWNHSWKGGNSIAPATVHSSEPFAPVQSSVRAFPVFSGCCRNLGWDGALRYVPCAVMCEQCREVWVGPPHAPDVWCSLEMAFCGCPAWIFLWNQSIPPTPARTVIQPIPFVCRPKCTLKCADRQAQYFSHTSTQSTSQRGN